MKKFKKYFPLPFWYSKITVQLACKVRYIYLSCRKLMTAVLFRLGIHRHLSLNSSLNVWKFWIFLLCYIVLSNFPAHWRKQEVVCLCRAINKKSHLVINYICIQDLSSKLGEWKGERFEKEYVWVRFTILSWQINCRGITDLTHVLYSVGFYCFSTTQQEQGRNSNSNRDRGISLKFLDAILHNFV